MANTSPDRDAAYYGLISSALQECMKYRPRFGQGRDQGVTLEAFLALYQRDPFYSWFGLDSPLVYAAHKAAGGMTSVYRQIGIGCQRVFQQLIRDQLGLCEADATWSYTVPTTRGKTRSLSLDGRIPLGSFEATAQAACIRGWLSEAALAVGLPPKRAALLEGAVFEVRQGYKSKDSKRQNADVSNASNAYAHAYLPAVVLLSLQIDDDISERYARARWLILRGSTGGTALDSTYVFCREVLGYDLAAFFDRNADRIRTDTHRVFEELLR